MGGRLCRPHPSLPTAARGRRCHSPLRADTTCTARQSTRERAAVAPDVPPAKDHEVCTSRRGGSAVHARGGAQEWAQHTAKRSAGGGGRGRIDAARAARRGHEQWESVDEGVVGKRTGLQGVREAAANNGRRAAAPLPRAAASVDHQRRWPHRTRPSHTRVGAVTGRLSSRWRQRWPTVSPRGAGEGGHPNDSAAARGIRQPPPQLRSCGGTVALRAGPRAKTAPRNGEGETAAAAGSPWARVWRSMPATVAGGSGLEGGGGHAKR